MNDFVLALRDRLANLHLAKQEVLARTIQLEVEQVSHKTVERARKIERCYKDVKTIEVDMVRVRRLLARFHAR